jgi:CBS domain-containing protein
MITEEEKIVSEWMSKSVITIDLNDRINKVQELFEEHSIHHLIVLEGGSLAGIISTDDLLKAYQQKGKNLTLARDIMTPNPMTIEQDDNIGLAADIILANKFHALPVLDGLELVGIITSHDLIRCYYDL